MKPQNPEFALIESLLYSDTTGYQRLESHLRRLSDSATALGFRFSSTEVEHVLDEQAAQLGAGDYKVRVLLERSGSLRSDAQPVEQADGTPEVMLAAAPVDSGSVLAGHKTTDRAHFDRHLARARSLGLADVLFLNERGELAEAASNNIFLELAGELLTPPLGAGILPGVYRGFVLETNRLAREQSLTKEDLGEAAAVYLCNSVRGWRQVTLRPGLLRL